MRILKLSELVSKESVWMIDEKPHELEIKDPHEFELEVGEESA